jgi:TonB family protein
MLLRPEAASRGPRLTPIAVSLIAHMSVLALVAYGPRPEPKHESLYRREIAPREKKLVWYRFSKKLPEVSPPKQKAAARPPRAEVKHPDQTIVSRSPNSEPAKQTILTPGPELKIQQDLAAPNLMAFEAPKPPDPPPQPKLFMPPPEIARAVEQPALENGPTLAATAPHDLPPIPTPRVPKPAPKAFVPPTLVARQTDAPKLQLGEVRIDPAPLNQLPIAQIAGPSRPKPKAFAPPPKSTPRADAALTLPALPASGPKLSNPTLVAGIPTQIVLPARPKPKAFTPPAPKPVVPADRPAILAAAPAFGTQSPRTTLAAVPVEIAVPAKPQAKTFTPPEDKAVPPAPIPELETPAANLTAAVVGLNPIDSPMPIIPEGSRPAQFSAAPELSPKGGAGGPVESAMITIPDLMIRGAGPKKESLASLVHIVPTSRENLLAAARPMIRSGPSPDPPKPGAGAVRVSAAPDPRFEGRTVYTVALQMPNVTSYSGSWILWYAERKPLPGEAHEMSAPSALRKVDPVYDLSAVDDRVEGKVQLGAVIHTDGYVYGITVLRGADPRLDNSAVAALRKWEFEPARRDGVPVDVDVVIEIPFRLRPLVKK